MLYQQEPSFHAALWDVIAALDTQARLPELALPALVIVGAEDASTPVSAAHTLAQALGMVSVHAIPGASHFANLEAPEAVNDLLRSFFGSFS